MAGCVDCSEFDGGYRRTLLNLQPFVETPGPKVFRPDHGCVRKPGRDGFAGPFGDLETHGDRVLLWVIDAPFDLTAREDIRDRQLFEFAPARFAADGQVEQRKFPVSIRNLQ